MRQLGPETRPVHGIRTTRSDFIDIRIVHTTWTRFFTPGPDAQRDGLGRFVDLEAHLAKHTCIIEGEYSVPASVDVRRP
jgi:hypothetical protein